VALDEPYLLAAVRHVSLNPVRARLVERAQDWPWSNVRAHLAGTDDGVVRVAPVLERVGDFAAFLDEAFDENAAYGPLRRCETTGRPLGSAAWIERLESDLDRWLWPRKRGPKPKRVVATTE
jgi:putative transposase